MASRAPLTELEAINSILRRGQLFEVSNLTSDLANSPAATQAVETLNDVSRVLQGQGWSFNTRTDEEVAPVGNEISLASNVLNASLNGSYEIRDTVRDGKLYDLKSNSSTAFTSPQYSVTYVEFLDWTDLPDYARNYILVKATRKFLMEFARDSEMYQYLEPDEMQAHSYFTAQETQGGDLNLLTNSSIVRNRTRAPRGNYGWRR